MDEEKNETGQVLTQAYIDSIVSAQHACRGPRPTRTVPATTRVRTMSDLVGETFGTYRRKIASSGEAERILFIRIEKGTKRGNGGGQHDSFRSP